MLWGLRRRFLRRNWLNWKNGLFVLSCFLLLLAWNGEMMSAPIATVMDHEVTLWLKAKYWGWQNRKIELGSPMTPWSHSSNSHIPTSNLFPIGGKFLFWLICYYLESFYYAQLNLILMVIIFYCNNQFAWIVSSTVWSHKYCFKFIFSEDIIYICFYLFLSCML